MPDDDLRQVRAELTAARARIQELERQVAEIVGSPTWGLALRLRAWKRKIAAGASGRPVALLIRVAAIARNEGARGVAVRVIRRLWRRRDASHPLAKIATVLPRYLPPMAVPPMSDAHGVSIVIPVLNKAVLTYHCLKSVIEHTAAGRYEVIAIDNASTDETPTLLAHVQRLRVIQNQVNRGFVEACNQGAKEACGEFLLFLNNDTVVLEGWLEPMVDTLARHQKVGAVGPQLLYLDGRLQEAGGIIWKDGTGWNYGRDDDPHRPEYRYLRQVDYCSGACLLVRRELFEQLGGFDARYAPAYYEDADLCFELRRLGYQVVYQPKARIVHLEGATAGTDLHAGFKRYQEINRAKFVEKHAAALAAQLPPDPASVFRARDRQPGKRILFVDHMLPLHDQDAGSVRMLAMLQILGDLGHKVIFIPDNLAALEAYLETLQQLGVEVHYGPMSIPEYIETHLTDFDAIVICRATVAIKHLPAITAHASHPPVIFDTVDLHFLREQRQAELEGDSGLASEARVTKTTELYLAAASDMVWVVSPYEAEVLRREHLAVRIEVVPLIHMVRESVPPFPGRRDLMFIGSFRHPPNEDAVLYFAKEIFPLVKREIPGVRFLVVGTNVPPTVQGLSTEDVVIAGYVKDPDPVFDACRVFVAPLRYGAGLKGKISHSLACGLPVVTTTNGAEGMHLIDREHVLIADQPDDFVARVVELYQDEALWTRLSERGRCHVKAHFGHDIVKAKLDAILRTL